MATKRLRDALEENVQFISRALDQIEAGNAPQTELHNVRVYLTTTLDLIEPETSITEAADELSRQTAECVAEQERAVIAGDELPFRTDHVQGIREALSRFRDALSAARPSVQALKLGLS